MHVAWTAKEGELQDVELPIGKGNVFAMDYLGAQQPAQILDGPEPSVYDEPTTHTYRFHVTHEPLYIWDAQLPRPIRKPAE